MDLNGSEFTVSCCHEKACDSGSRQIKICWRGFEEYYQPSLHQSDDISYSKQEMLISDVLVGCVGQETQTINL